MKCVPLSADSANNTPLFARIPTGYPYKREKPKLKYFKLEQEKHRGVYSANKQNLWLGEKMQKIRELNFFWHFSPLLGEKKN